MHSTFVLKLFLLLNSLPCIRFLSQTCGTHQLALLTLISNVFCSISLTFESEWYRFDSDLSVTFVFWLDRTPPSSPGENMMNRFDEDLADEWLTDKYLSCVQIYKFRESLIEKLDSPLQIVETLRKELLRTRLEKIHSREFRRTCLVFRGQYIGKTRDLPVDMLKERIEYDNAMLEPRNSPDSGLQLFGRNFSQAKSNTERERTLFCSFQGFPP